MVQISSMTEAVSLAGTEDIPASVSGAARRVRVSTIRQDIIDQIEAISSTGSVGAGDGIYILDADDSALKPVDIDVLLQRAIDTIWGKVDSGTPTGTDEIALKESGGTEQTCTLANLATYIRTAIESTILDVSDLADGSGGLATTDYLLVTQGTTARQITVQDIYDAIYTGLASHVTGKSSAGTVLGTDEVYVVRSGTGYKTTMADISTYVSAAATITGSGTSGYLASWSAPTVLGAAYQPIPSATGFVAGTDTDIPTTKCVRDEMDQVIFDSADIGAALADADTILVDDGGLGTTQRKSALSRIWTWINAKTDLALSVLDIDGGVDIGAALVDADLLIVDDGAGGTNRKSALSRVWTYIQSKITANLLQDMTEGSGLSSAAVLQHSVMNVGGLKKTHILVDLTGLVDGNALNDIIGDTGGASNCTLCQITTAVNGTIRAGRVTCFETPTGGITDVDIYSAVEGTGAQSSDVTALTETQLLNHGAWAIGQIEMMTSLPAADEYLYLVDGVAGGAATYTGGILLIELWGE